MATVNTAIMSIKTLYAVVHLRFKGENRRREVQEKICERWFSNLPDAKACLQRIHAGTTEFTFDAKGESHKRDCRRIYRLELDAKAKSFSVRNPRCDAERLAHKLKLDATAGVLLVEKPNKRAAAVKS